MLLDSMMTWSEPFKSARGGRALLRRGLPLLGADPPYALGSRCEEARCVGISWRFFLDDRPGVIAFAQSHASPLAEQMPCPYCVILKAVQWNSGSAEIRPATTLVLPTLREWPPITMMDMGAVARRQSLLAGHSLMAGGRWLMTKSSLQN
jgi:hypothetical protein